MLNNPNNPLFPLSFLLSHFHYHITTRIQIHLWLTKLLPRRHFSYLCADGNAEGLNQVRLARWWLLCVWLIDSWLRPMWGNAQHKRIPTESPARRLPLQPVRFERPVPRFPIYTLRPTQIEASFCRTMVARAAVPERRQSAAPPSACRDNLSRDSNC